MNGHKVETATVEVAGSDVRKAAGAVDGHMHSLSTGAGVLRTLWTGAASDAFGGAHSGWQADMHGMVVAGELLAAALEESAAIYDRADRAVARAWLI